MFLKLLASERMAHRQHELCPGARSSASPGLGHRALTDDTARVSQDDLVEGQ